MVEQVLQAGPEQVNDQDVVEAFLAEVIDIRNSGCVASVLLAQHVFVGAWVCGGAVVRPPIGAATTRHAAR